MSDQPSASRPRRSTRQVAKAAEPHEEESPIVPEKKTPGRKEPGPDEPSTGRLEEILTSKKSKLTKVDIADVINYANFLDLSPEAQHRLIGLLPPTAFSTFRPSAPPTHIDYNEALRSDNDAMDVDVPPQDGPSSLPLDSQNYGKQDRTAATLDPAVFTSPFFLSAARTFQDHLYSGWLGQKARDEVAQFEKGIRDGSLHAEWKDEVWARDHSPGQNDTPPLDLTALAKHGLLQKGDLLCYTREFPQLQLVVEKDLLIESVSARHKTVSLLLAPSTRSSLPPSLLVAEAQVTDEHVLSMSDVADPCALENGVLDVDGRVGKEGRYSSVAGPSRAGSRAGYPGSGSAGDSWRAFTVWRWREEMREAVEMQTLQERGGRERFGTLYYLRTYCSS